MDKTITCWSTIFLAVIISFTFQCSAQNNLGFSESPSGLSMVLDGTQLLEPAVGGLNTPQFSEIDLNFDGVQDLFVFDRGTDVVRTYIYNVSTQRYEYAPQFETAFPSDLREFALLRDYDCDGFADLFTYHIAGFRVFRNNGSAPLSFTKVTDKILSNYGSITTGAFVLAGDVPAIVDVDGDGDLDILTFGLVNSENTIEYHRNLSQDLYNSCDSLQFEVVTQCWGNIEEPANSAALVEVNCKGVVPPVTSERGVHPGSSILLLDADNDGDKDLVLGDIQTDKVVFAINIGTPEAAIIDVNQQTNDFPNGEDPVTMPYLVSGYEVDVDHDGNLDLVMTVNNSIDSSANTNHTWYYVNTSSGQPDYELANERFLLENCLDLGAGVSPAVMDVNGDGRLDLLLANDYRRAPSGGTRSRIYYFEQQVNGTLELVNSDFAGISAFNFQSACISLGDMDSDGDLDMLLGDQAGNLHFFRNNPSGGVAQFVLVEPIYMGINTIGSNAAPAIADINQDGLLDLLVGERTGVVSYFENTGTATQPFFSASATIPNVGGIDVSEACCLGNAKPQYINVPELANGPHLMVGSDEKKILFYQVPGNIAQPWPLVDSMTIRSGKLAPIFTDFDGNGIYELLAGTAEGGFKFFTREQNAPIGTKEVVNNPSMLRIFPNPAGDELFVQSKRPLQGVVRILSTSGQVLRSQWVNNHSEVTIPIETLPAGIYILECRSNDAICSERFTTLR